MHSSGKTVEHEIVMRDDLGSGQYRGIAREMRIGDERDIVTQSDSATASCVYAVFGHAADNDQVLDAPALQFFRKFRLKEGVRCPLVNDGLPVQRTNGSMDGPIRGIDFNRMSLGPIMLDEQNV